MTEREAPRHFQILTLFLIAIAGSWQSNNVASGIPGEPFKVRCACIALWAIQITSSVTVCATTYCITRGNYSGCFPFAFSRHLIPCGLLPQRPHCPRNDGMRSCPCKMNRFFQVSSGPKSGRTYSAAVTHIEVCATRYRTRHCNFPRIYHSVNHSPFETPLQQQTVRSARRKMI